VGASLLANAMVPLCNAERCLRAEFGDVPQVTEREGEGERPRSRVPENAQVVIGRSVDAGVLVSIVDALT